MSKGEALVTASELLSESISTLQREARRLQNRKGVRETEELNRTAKQLTHLSNSYGSLLLPSARVLAELLGDVLGGSDATPDDDAVLWDTALCCGLMWPSGFAPFVTAVLVATPPRVARAAGALTLLPTWLNEAISPWSQLLEATSSHVDSSALATYTASVCTVDVPRTSTLCESWMLHMSTLLLIMRPASPVLCERSTVLCRAHGSSPSVEVRGAANRLRLILSSITHPRCAPLAVPLSVETAALPSTFTSASRLPEASESPIYPSRGQTMFQHPAAQLRQLTAPLPLKMHRPETEITGEKRRPESQAVLSRAHTAVPTVVADVEAPHIVDDDLE